MPWVNGRWELEDDFLQGLRNWSRLQARIQLGTYKGSDPARSAREAFGKGNLDELDSGVIRNVTQGDPNNPSVSPIKDFQEVITKGLTPSNVFDADIEGGEDRKKELENVAKNRKKLAGLFKSPQFLDEMFKSGDLGAEQLEYIRDTFDIGTAPSRKKGAKAQFIIDEFNRRRGEGEENLARANADATNRGLPVDPFNPTPPPVGGLDQPITPTENRAPGTMAGSLLSPGQAGTRISAPSPSSGKGGDDKDEGVIDRILNPVTSVGGKILEGIGRVPGVARGADILSRGNFAIAEAAQSQFEAFQRGETFGAADDAIKGFGAGLAGREKTTFDDVLGTVGVPKGRARSIAGFGLDVALDPTTYLTGGVGGAAKATVGKVGRDAAIKTAGARAFTEALESTTSKKIAAQAALQASDKAALEAAQKAIPGLKNKPGVTAQKKQFGLSVEDAGKQARYNYALDAKKAAEEKAFRETQKKLQIKFAGRQIVGSEAAYNQLARVGQRLAEKRSVQGLNQMFRTASYLPGETRAIANRFVNVGFNNWEDTDRFIKKELLPDITKDEAIQITHAIEEGVDLTGLKAASGTDLGVAQQKAKDMFADMWDAEEAYGVFGDKTPKANYVHHTYLAGNSKQQKYFKKMLGAVGTENPGFAKAQLIPTLKDAKKAGLQPVEDIRDILSIRAGKSHQVRARAGFAEEVAREYGVKANKAEAKRLGLEQADSNFLDKDTYLPPDIAKTLKGVEKLQDDPKVYNEFTKHLDKITNTWKLLATGPNPGFHIRNLQGDTFLNYMAGVNSPKPYMRAARIQMPGGMDAKFKVGKSMFTGRELWQEFIQSGSKSSFGVAELPNRATANYVPNKYIAPIRNISETRENFTRFAHFLDKVEKGNVKDYKDLRQAGIEAAKSIDKFNYNYLDLTPFEKNYAKKAIPFYVFMRKNIPLQLESALLRPGKLATKAKSFSLIEQMLGTNELGPANVELGTEAAEWAKNVTDEDIKSGESIRTGPGAVYNPRLPTENLTEIVQQLAGESGNENIGDYIGQKLNPIAGIPIQLTTGHQFLGGRNIYDTDKFFTDQNVGVGKLLQRLLSSANTEQKKKAIQKWIYSGFNAEDYPE